MGTGMEKYKEIIGHEHHVSTKHPRMSTLDRAAQFAPFAALTGYDSVIAETGRETSQKAELDEMQLLRLNKALMTIQERLTERPEVRITMFVPDKRKKGGRYTVIEGKVRNLDHGEKTLILCDDSRIPLKDLLSVVLHSDCVVDRNS